MLNQRRMAQVLLGVLWVSLGLSSVILWWFSAIPATEVPRRLADWVDGFGTLPATGLFLALYAVRPLVLFPSSVMGLASGMTFGPVLGSLVTMGGELIGSLIAFSLGRLFGRRFVRAHERTLLTKWDRRLSENGVLTVAILRLVSLPFDSVSYASGLTGIRLRDFLAGTMLGGTFYILSVTLLGGSAATDLVGQWSLFGLTLSHRALTLALAAFCFLLGLVIAWRLRHRYLGPSLEPTSK